MTASLQPDAKLPAIREDLQVMRSSRQKDGSISWLIYDPLRNRYFQTSRHHLDILRSWDAGSPERILERLANSDIEHATIEEFIRFLYANSLMQDPPAGDVQSFVDQAKATKRSLLETIIHNYLFIRVPLVRPHHFLKKTIGLTDLFFSRGWAVFILITAIVGGYLALWQWDIFIHTFLHFFNLKGLLFYFFTLVFVKICHEFGHAYAATRYGCRIPTMGVAFLVMFPVLYTDTTDSWKLSSRRQRLTIAAAGVLIELMIAVLATFFWAFLPDGVWRSAAFFIATTCWILSLAVNLNPLMRFDGYHFLSDLIGIQNLQARSFAFGRWKMREILFDFDDPAPEALTKKMQNGLIVFSWATWVYRFFLFLGIALLVHALFFKALGIFLFIVEIGWFIMLPIINELKEWGRRREDMTMNGRTAIWGIGIVLLVFALFVPWHSTIRVPAVLEAAYQETLHGRDSGEIIEVLVRNDDIVAKGDILISIHSKILEQNIAQENKRIALLRARLDRIVADQEDLDQKLVLQQELIRANETLFGLKREEQALNIKAPFDGVIIDLDPTLHKGRWIHPEIPLATLITKERAHIRGYLAGKHIDRLDQASKAKFVPFNHEYGKVRGSIKTISASNTDVISIPALSSRYGGPVAVAEGLETLTPLGAWYNTIMDVQSGIDSPTQQIPGEIHAKGRAESFAVKVWRRVVHVFIRETTF